MEHIEKTVFISYRRLNFPWALAVWQSLKQQGYDVFIDYAGLASGDYESALLENISARAHFLIILTPSALERCGEPNDMMRREMETALRTKRNIVPLMLEGFSFSTPAISNQLIGTLAPIKSYQALSVPNEYFSEAMDKLRNRFLNITLAEVTHPPSASAQQVAAEQSAAAEAAPLVQEQELTVQQYFERALASSDQDEKVRLYNEVIRLKPDFGEAYNNRGIARKDLGDIRGALHDYDQSIKLIPSNAEAYVNRAVARKAMGDLEGALEDCNKALDLRPGNSEAYSNRGGIRAAKGDLDGALGDCDRAIRGKPENAVAWFNRCLALAMTTDITGAINDCTKTIQLKPDFIKAYAVRGKLFAQSNQHVAAIADFRQYLTLQVGVTDEETETIEQVIRYLEGAL